MQLAFTGTSGGSASPAPRVPIRQGAQRGGMVGMAKPGRMRYRDSVMQRAAGSGLMTATSAPVSRAAVISSGGNHAATTSSAATPITHSAAGHASPSGPASPATVQPPRPLLPSSATSPAHAPRAAAPAGASTDASAHAVPFGSLEHVDVAALPLQLGRAFEPPSPSLSLCSPLDEWERCGRGVSEQMGAVTPGAQSLILVDTDRFEGAGSGRVAPPLSLAQLPPRTVSAASPASSPFDDGFVVVTPASAGGEMQAGHSKTKTRGGSVGTPVGDRERT